MRRCILGLHKFSEWRPLDSHSFTDPCQTRRTCERCGKEQIRKLAKIHEWIYAKPNNPCDLTRHCKNCGYKDVRYPQHEYGPFKYAYLDRCETTRTCTKCGNILRTTQHEYGPSEYIASNS